MTNKTKKVKTIVLEDSSELQQFYNYCKQQNKVVRREVLKAIALYLNSVKQQNESQEN